MSSPDFLTDDLADLDRLRRMEQRCEAILESLEDVRHFFPDTGLPTQAGILSGAMQFILGETTGRLVEAHIKRMKARAA